MAGLQPKPVRYLVADSDCVLLAVLASAVGLGILKDPKLVEGATVRGRG
jgi:hypothetical protein